MAINWRDLMKLARASRNFCGRCVGGGSRASMTVSPFARRLLLSLLLCCRSSHAQWSFTNVALNDGKLTKSAGASHAYDAIAVTESPVLSATWERISAQSSYVRLCLTYTGDIDEKCTSGAGVLLFPPGPSVERNFIPLCLGGTRTPLTLLHMPLLVE